MATDIRGRSIVTLSHDGSRGTIGLLRLRGRVRSDRCSAPVERARRPEGHGPLAAARRAITYTSKGVFRADSPEPEFD